MYAKIVSEFMDRVDAVFIRNVHREDQAALQAARYRNCFPPKRRRQNSVCSSIRKSYRLDCSNQVEMFRKRHLARQVIKPIHPDHEPGDWPGGSA